METLDHTYLLSQLRYEPETGLFWWRTPRSKRRLNIPAGSQNKNGYTTIKLDRKPFLLHRLAWFYVMKEWPQEIDHIDRNPANNMISNLRACNRQENCYNRVSRTTSGIKGVVRLKGRMKWRASIWINKKGMFLGHFDTKEEAKQAYETALKEFNNEFYTKEILHV